MVVFCINTGIGDVHFPDNELSLFPNPAQEELNLTFTIEPTHCDIEIYDIFGRLVHRGQYQKSIAVHTLSSGLYLMKILQDKKIYFKNFVKS